MHSKTARKAKRNTRDRAQGVVESPFVARQGGWFAVRDVAKDLRELAELTRKLELCYRDVGGSSIQPENMIETDEPRGQYTSLDNLSTLHNFSTYALRQVERHLEEAKTSMHVAVRKLETRLRAADWVDLGGVWKPRYEVKRALAS